LLKHLIVHLKELSARLDRDRHNRLAAVIADELTEPVSADLHLPIPSDRRAAKVALAMIDDPSDERDLAAWGREVGASGRTLTRHFSAETGLSFSEWRQRCRLFAALEMLSAGKSITPIALMPAIGVRAHSLLHLPSYLACRRSITGSHRALMVDESQKVNEVLMGLREYTPCLWVLFEVS